MKRLLNRLMGVTGSATVATTLIISLLVSASGFYLLSRSASATTLTLVKDTLSTSAPATASNHAIQFVTQHNIANGDTIKIEFDTLGTTDQFTINSLLFSDIDLKYNTAGNCSGSLFDHTIATTFATASSTFTVAISSSTDDITFTATSTAGTYIPSGSCVIVRVGTNATYQSTGVNQIVNPAKTAAAGIADVNDVKITFTGTPSADSGSALVATIDQVTVSVTVDSSLSFSISGVAGASCTQGTGTQVTTTSTTVPFGSSLVAVNTFYRGCQDLVVSTNASSGYAITAEENTSLLSGSITLDDTRCDYSSLECSEVVGSASTTPWATATNNGFGYTCSGSSCNSAFATASEYNQFACTGSDAQCNPGSGGESAQTPISTSTPVSADTSRIVYRLSVSGTQPAGSYSNTITYIATPTF